MKQRIITGLIALAVFVIVILIGEQALFYLILLINAGALYEYITIVADHKDYYAIIVTELFGSALIVAAAYFRQLLLPLLVMGILFIFIKGIMNKESDAQKTVYNVWGLIYVSFFLSLATSILFGNYGLYIAVTTVLACIGCDTFAYFIGIKFGKHKLSPSISPKKSIEGSIAGFFGAILLCIISGYLRFYFGAEGIPTSFFIAAGVIIGLAAQFGDLSASLIKRKFGAKDYSNILPGHGGLLDRIDSILFAFAAMYVFISVFFIVN